MEAEVTVVASGSSSNKVNTQECCVTCGIQGLRTPRMWACDECGDHFLCESCYNRSPAPLEVHSQDHTMSAHVMNFMCDGCGSNPLWSPRWCCEVCPDFDLCEACYGTLDASEMPPEHLKEHPMVAVEVICSEMMLKCQPNFSKPMDPQWSYEGGWPSYGFSWRKRKPRMFSGMDDAIIQTSAGDDSISIPKFKEQINPNFKNLFLKEALEVKEAYGMLDKKHKVFLSHAGVDKDFVEQLHRDLLRVHHFGIFFDKDDDSLPKGEPFPERIFVASKHCELAIVVISHEYFIRKWPMLELVAFVAAQKRRPELKILPVFYKLSVEEFKKRQDLFRKSWNEMGLVSRDGMDGWKDALKVISRTNGLEYDKKMGEVGLRDRIVEVVYKQVNPELMWDDSHVQGISQMQEMIQEMFLITRNLAGEVLLESTLRMGLFGMGGSGKTTMCKVLRNQMMPHYLGKVCHIEFGGVDLLQMRIKLLQGICQLESTFLRDIDKGQVLTLLKTHIPKQRVCLIIDNVTDSLSSIEEARTLLNLPFKEGSLIVVTSRSPIVLENLGIGRELRMRMPSLSREKAKALFSHHAGCDTSSLTEDQLEAMESFVERCNFKVKDMASKEYHPLALKVLGSQVGRNAEMWPSLWIDFKFYEDEDTHPVFSVLRSSFDTLSLKYKSIFLDIALHSGASNVNLRMSGLQWQLRCLHGESDQRFGYKVVEVLQAKSLVEYYDVESSVIYVHDLYREFARMEVEKKGLQHGGRCCFSRGSKRDHALQEGRIRIHDHHVSHITKDILSCTICSEAEVLSVQDCANLVSVDVPGLENLKEFHVVGGCPQLTCVNLEGATNLRMVSWRGFEGNFYIDLRSLESLEGLWLINDEGESPPTLHGCLDFSRNSNLELLYLSFLPLNLLNLHQVVLLRWLILLNCQHLERLEGLETLAQLEHLDLRACSSLKEFPSLANFRSLKVFRLDGAEKLKSIHGFTNLIALQQLTIRDAGQLEELLGIEACTKLNILDLFGTNIGDCSWISMMMDLTSIELSGTKIRFMPDCSNLCKLSELWLHDCKVLKSIGDMTRSVLPIFPQSLRILSARNCPTLYSIPYFHHGSALEYLEFGGTCVEDVYGLTHCKHLQKLICPKTRITSLPDLSGLTRLMALNVSGCELLTTMDNIKSLPALEKLFVFGCTSLLALPDLQSSMRLMELILFNCPLLDPNTVKLPSSSTIDMDIDMEDNVDDNDSDNNIDVQECEDERSAMANFQASKHNLESGDFQHSLTWWQWVGSWCGGWNVTRGDGN